MTFRLAAAADSGAIRRIYGQYIETPITFETALPGEAAFALRMQEIRQGWPCVVCGDGAGVAGYAYAHPFRQRAAYQWGAELSVYVDRARTGRGLGRRLYVLLMDLLRLQGVRTAYGCVTVPNPASEGLHAALGFRRAGVFRSAGFKAGAWHDVAWFEKAIAPYDPSPAPVRPIREVPAGAAAEILERYSE